MWFFFIMRSDFQMLSRSNIFDKLVTQDVLTTSMLLRGNKCKCNVKFVARTLILMFETHLVSLAAGISFLHENQTQINFRLAF